MISQNPKAQTCCVKEWSRCGSTPPQRNGRRAVAGEFSVSESRSTEWTWRPLSPTRGLSAMEVSDHTFPCVLFTQGCFLFAPFRKWIPNCQWVKPNTFLWHSQFSRSPFQPEAPVTVCHSSFSTSSLLQTNSCCFHSKHLFCMLLYNGQLHRLHNELISQLV